MVSQCTWDGTLSSEDFRFAARAFSKRWKDTNPTLPQWMWISQPKSSIFSLCEEEGYLSLENIHYPRFTEDYTTSCHLGSGEENVDCATMVLNDDQEMHIYDYHIVYNFSYKVPVLYFRGYQCDGQPLRSDEIQSDLPPCSLSILKDSKWTYMTQEEHPFLCRPWYMLHPCGTSEWIKLLFSNCGAMEGYVLHQYLPSWLSVVGQAVGLKIPLEVQNKSSTSLH
uniref:Ubiquitin-like-conjugating enzyme ATG10 n=1 Tax=Anthurium amnicola TaxID=1678845 RepID=A0A1D1ZG92_9ARAE